MIKVGEIEEKPIQNAADYQSQTMLITREVDPDLSGQLAKVDNHEARIELLLVAILKQLKVP